MPVLSGFTFIHNGIEGGYPFIEAIYSVWPFLDEIVVIDADSDDGTLDVLLQMGDKVRVIDARWGNRAGETLARLHAMNELCRGDVIVHFEADEVWDPNLLGVVTYQIRYGQGRDFVVYRIQVEQNFQRVRWYPWPVHRVFPRGSVKKIGESTNRHGQAMVVSADHGLLWDCTNCFRDDWLGRIKNQSILRNQEALNLLAVPNHANGPNRVDDIDQFLAQPHWTYTTSPLALPDILRPLVGRTSYAPV